ncbi:biopolymer transporter ExbD [Pseudooceanicola sp.]|uniref:biopolymer transporter ExbD n=1 Tax=Pseudooceanicola sp. TaxID=1914328 RepID=UPI0035C71791
MTSLIDVIFLLLLFFMLTSTFSKFAEVELTAAGASAGGVAARPPLFLRLAPETLSLNGKTLALDGLSEALAPEADSETPRQLIVALAPEVTAQRLTDLMVSLRGISGVSATVLGSGS